MPDKENELATEVLRIYLSRTTIAEQSRFINKAGVMTFEEIVQDYRQPRSLIDIMKPYSNEFNKQFYNMEEKGLYYIPERREFKEGFEYEAYIPEKETWSKEVFYLNEAHLKLIGQNKLRAKYLDKEDIESFGFNYDGTIDFEGIDQQLFWLMDTKSMGSFIWNLDFWDSHLLIYNKYAHHEGKGVCVSMAEPKNKSELGVLLRQLGYEQE